MAVPEREERENTDDYHKDTYACRVYFAPCNDGVRPADNLHAERQVRIPGAQGQRAAFKAV